MPDEWKDFVEQLLTETKRLNDCIVKLTEEQVQLRIDVAVLKTKAGVWGFLAGLIPALGASIYWIIKHSK